MSIKDQTPINLSAAKADLHRGGAVLALLSSKDVEDAARTAGITPRTLYRWMNEPDFDAAFRAARRQAYGQSISRLQQGATAAATTLLRVMIDPATPARPHGCGLLRQS